MKKFILFVAAALAVVACQKNFDINYPIAFNDSKVITKAIVENGTFPDGDFGVFADINTIGQALTAQGTDFMNNDMYTNAGGTITAATTKYWIANTQTQFYAYYPYSAGVTNYLLDVNASVKDDACIDVMLAKPAIVTYNAEDDAPGAVALNFEHQLAFIEFQVKEGTIVSEVAVNDVTFTVNQTAKLNVKTGAWSDKGGSGAYHFAKTSGITSSYASMGKVLVVPQDAVAITITYTAKVLGYTVGPKTRTIPVSKLGTSSWVGGKKYIYKISIDSSDVISFSSSVSGWQDGAGTGTVIY